jgi:THO complex subunit 1
MSSYAVVKKAVLLALASGHDDEESVALAVNEVLRAHAGARSCLEQCVRERMSGASSEAAIERELAVGMRLLQSGALKGEAFVTLAQDVLEAADIGTCERRFSLIERHAGALAAALGAGSKTPLLVLLRMCVELMRRMSKSEHTAFCGRVLLFLAQVYPLSDPSGVNLKGELNTANVTLFEDEATFAAAADAADAADAAAAASTAAMKKTPTAATAAAATHDRPIDYQFYKTFWSLQVQLRDTSGVLASADLWHQFEAALDTVMAALSTQRVTVAGRSADSAHGAAAAAAASAASEVDTFVKYLTSSSLLDLQLSDASFRRHVLLQMLIAFQTLLDKKPADAAGADPLSSTQRTRVVALKKRALALLRATPPHGDVFEAAVSRLLRREGGWTAWKAGGCQSFEREREALKRKRDVAPPPSKRALAASSGLVSSSGGGVVSLTVAESNDQAMRAGRAAPTFDELLQPLRNDLVEFEDDVDFTTDHVFSWRLMRGAACNKLGLLTRLVGLTKASDVFKVVDQDAQARDAKLKSSAAGDKKNEDDEKEGDEQKKKNDEEDGLGNDDDEANKKAAATEPTAEPSAESTVEAAAEAAAEAAEAAAESIAESTAELTEPTETKNDEDMAEDRKASGGDGDEEEGEEAPRDEEMADVQKNKESLEKEIDAELEAATDALESAAAPTQAQPQAAVAEEDFGAL